MFDARDDYQQQHQQGKKNPTLRKDYPPAYLEWQRIVTKKMSHLSKPQAVGLAMWSFGIAVTHCCGLSTVTVFLAEVLGQKENNIRERLRQWYKEGSDRGGRKRASIDVKASFVPLLQWILSWWSSESKNLVLAADASTLGERFTVLLISVVVRGCGIPVAWKIVGATDKGSWKPYWIELFEQIQSGIPHDWKVIVTTDRGLYAKWMYEAIKQCQWHPFMRINQQGFYHLTSHQRGFSPAWMPLQELIVKVDQHFQGHVTCFKSNSLSCTLLARWDQGYSDPWLIVTDLPPSEATICWYGMRSWIECLFKDLKRGGLGWHHTKMTDPQRAERLWLAIAVATLWMVSLGGKADASIRENSLSLFEPEGFDGEKSTQQADSGSSSSKVSPESQSTTPENDRSLIEPVQSSPTPMEINFYTEEASVPGLPHRSNQPRWLSCFRRGFVRLLAALIKQDPLPTVGLIPDYSFATG